jgi:hypothetical protein
MPENNTEYGAIHGMMMEWSEADLAASRAQQAAMDAQRATHERGEQWQELSLGHRAILAAEAANSTPLEA